LRRIAGIELSVGWMRPIQVSIVGPDAERLKEIGAEGFAAPMKVACEDHNGHNSAYMARWDGTKWTQGSDWIAPLKTKVRPLIESAAKDYSSANAGWPKRTEPCDKSS
jgi:branched-chain amino acid transport system substrate-binding protein